VADPDAVVERMLAQTGLAARAGDEVGRLSGGNRQRVNIAVGVLSEPDVLLLDEPSSSLDPRQRALMWEFIHELAAGGTTVVYSTHDIAEADRHSHRLLLLADGELLFDGCGPDLGTERDLETAFVNFLKAKGH
jgi:ABC-type multidrug transport system ATPase subunit